MPGLILDAEGAVVAPWEARHGCVGAWVRAWGHLLELHELWLKTGGSLPQRGRISACMTWCRHPKILGPCSCKRFSYHLSFFAQILSLKPERPLVYLTLSMCVSVCRAGAAVHCRSTPQLPNYQ